jgi:hypothetical protein
VAAVMVVVTGREIGAACRAMKEGGAKNHCYCRSTSSKKKKKKKKKKKQGEEEGRSHWAPALLLLVIDVSPSLGR